MKQPCHTPTTTYQVIAGDELRSKFLNIRRRKAGLADDAAAWGNERLRIEGADQKVEDRGRQR
jgi:hypothetical protein